MPACTRGDNFLLVLCARRLDNHKGSPRVKSSARKDGGEDAKERGELGQKNYDSYSRSKTKREKDETL